MNTTSNIPEVHAQTVARIGVDEAAIHRLVHGFFLIDNQIILDIAQNDTEILAASIDRLIEKIK